MNTFSGQQMQSFSVSMIARLKYHALALVILTIAICLGQYLHFIGGSGPILTADTPGYIGYAKNLRDSFPFRFNVFRTPGYPEFLNIVYLFKGVGNNQAVVFAQAIVMAFSFYEIYFLTYRMSHSRLIAGGISTFFSLDFFILTYENQIMTETLSFWSVVTLFLIIERYLATDRLRYVALMGVWLVVMIMIRPIFAFLPPIILILFAARNVLNKNLMPHWKHLALATTIVFIGVFGYMFGNKLQSHYLGISYVGGVNLIAKTLEYNMVHLSAGSSYNDVQKELIAYYDSGQREPWNFVQHAYYSGLNYAHATGLATSIIVHHPVEFTVKALGDVIVVWQIPSQDLTYYGSAQGLVHVLDSLYKWLFSFTYLILPLLAIIAGYLFWQKKDDKNIFLLFLLSLAIIGQIVMIGLASYGVYDRLRFPMDWIAPVVFVLLIQQIVIFFQQRGTSKIPASTDKTGVAATYDLSETVKRPAVR